MSNVLRGLTRKGAHADNSSKRMGNDELNKFAALYGQTADPVAQAEFKKNAMEIFIKKTEFTKDYDSFEGAEFWYMPKDEFLEHPHWRTKTIDAFELEYRPREKRAYVIIPQSAHGRNYTYMTDNTITKKRRKEFGSGETVEACVTAYTDGDAPAYPARPQELTAGPETATAQASCGVAELAGSSARTRLSDQSSLELTGSSQRTVAAGLSQSTTWPGSSIDTRSCTTTRRSSFSRNVAWNTRRKRDELSKEAAEALAAAKKIDIEDIVELADVAQPPRPCDMGPAGLLGDECAPAATQWVDTESATRAYLIIQETRDKVQVASTRLYSFPSEQQKLADAQACLERKKMLRVTAPDPEADEASEESANPETLGASLRNWNEAFAKSITLGDWAEASLDGAYEFAWFTNYRTRMAMRHVANPANDPPPVALTAELEATIVKSQDNVSLTKHLNAGGALHVILNGYAGRPKHVQVREDVRDSTTDSAAPQETPGSAEAASAQGEREPGDDAEIEQDPVRDALEIEFVNYAHCVLRKYGEETQEAEVAKGREALAAGTSHAGSTLQKRPKTPYERDAEDLFRAINEHRATEGCSPRDSIRRMPQALHEFCAVAAGVRFKPAVESSQEAPMLVDSLHELQQHTSGDDADAYKCLFEALRDLTREDTKEFQNLLVYTLTAADNDAMSRRQASGVRADAAPASMGDPAARAAHVLDNMCDASQKLDTIRRETERLYMDLVKKHMTEEPELKEARKTAESTLRAALEIPCDRASELWTSARGDGEIAGVYVALTGAAYSGPTAVMEAIAKALGNDPADPGAGADLGATTGEPGWLKRKIDARCSESCFDDDERKAAMDAFRAETCELFQVKKIRELAKSVSSASQMMSSISEAFAKPQEAILLSNTTFVKTPARVALKAALLRIETLQKALQVLFGFYTGRKIEERPDKTWYRADILRVAESVYKAASAFPDFAGAHVQVVFYFMSALAQRGDGDVAQAAPPPKKKKSNRRPKTGENKTPKRVRRKGAAHKASDKKSAKSDASPAPATRDHPHAAGSARVDGAAAGSGDDKDGMAGQDNHEKPMSGEHNNEGKQRGRKPGSSDEGDAGGSSVTPQDRSASDSERGNTETHAPGQKEDNQGENDNELAECKAAAASPKPTKPKSKSKPKTKAKAKAKAKSRTKDTRDDTTRDSDEEDQEIYDNDDGNESRMPQSMLVANAAKLDAEGVGNRNAAAAAATGAKDRKARGEQQSETENVEQKTEADAVANALRICMGNNAIEETTALVREAFANFEVQNPPLIPDALVVRLHAESELWRASSEPTTQTLHEWAQAMAAAVHRILRYAASGVSETMFEQDTKFYYDMTASLEQSGAPAEQYANPFRPPDTKSASPKELHAFGPKQLGNPRPHIAGEWGPNDLPNAGHFEAATMALAKLAGFLQAADVTLPNPVPTQWQGTLPVFPPGKHCGSVPRIFKAQLQFLYDAIKGKKPGDKTPAFRKRFCAAFRDALGQNTKLTTPAQLSCLYRNVRWSSVEHDLATMCAEVAGAWFTPAGARQKDTAWKQKVEDLRRRYSVGYFAAVGDTVGIMLSDMQPSAGVDSEMKYIPRELALAAAKCGYLMHGECDGVYKARGALHAAATDSMAIPLNNGDSKSESDDAATNEQGQDGTSQDTVAKIRAANAGKPA